MRKQKAEQSTHPDPQHALEVARLDYEMRNAEIRELLADINRNYQWVLGAVALIIGSQIFGLRWTQLRDLVLDQPWIVFVGAIALLWFPAYDITRWVDLRIAYEYLRDHLEPRLNLRRADAGGEPWIHWDDFRNRRLHARRGVLLPIWLGKFSLPYAPTLLLASTGIWALARQERWPTPLEWPLLATWGAMTLASTVAIVRAAALAPTSRRPAGGTP